MDQCLFCNKLLSDGTSVVLEKGLVGIQAASEIRGTVCPVHVGDRVHLACRRDYCRRPASAKDQVNEYQSSPPKQRAPSRSISASSFSFETHCLFCGGGKKPGWRGSPTLCLSER